MWCEQRPVVTNCAASQPASQPVCFLHTPCTGAKSLALGRLDVTELLQDFLRASSQHGLRLLAVRGVWDAGVLRQLPQPRLSSRHDGSQAQPYQYPVPVDDSGRSRSARSHIPTRPATQAVHGRQLTGRTHDQRLVTTRVLHKAGLRAESQQRDQRLVQGRGERRGRRRRRGGAQRAQRLHQELGGLRAELPYGMRDEHEEG